MLSGIAYEMTVNRDKLKDRKISLETRRHLFLAFKEVLHNIYKHAQASHVIIELGFDSESKIVFFRVSDNGVGFDMSKMQARGHGGGHGLKSLYRRADQAGGKLNLESKPGQGTTVEFLAFVN